MEKKKIIVKTIETKTYYVDSNLNLDTFIELMTRDYDYLMELAHSEMKIIVKDTAKDVEKEIVHINEKGSSK